MRPSNLMFFVFGLIAVRVLVCGARETQQVNKTVEEDDDEDTRDPKTLLEDGRQESWKAINHRHWQNSNEWTPNGNYPPVPPEITEQRRRRITKRRRRPTAPAIPVPSDSDASPSISHYTSSEEAVPLPPRRRKVTRPETLEDFGDPFAEMANEGPRRPTHRRRIAPNYSEHFGENDKDGDVKPSLPPVLQIGDGDVLVKNEDAITVTPKSVHYEKVRDPFTALEEAEAKASPKKQHKQQEVVENPKENETVSTTVSDLKNILKQSAGSISLSEILQHKNLSLEDLLKGKEHAISALTEKPPDVEEIGDMGVEIKEYRNPVEDYPFQPTEKIKSTTEATSLPYVEETTTKTNRDTTKKVYHTASRHSTLKNVEVVTEPTTERRVFVPSHPKYYTALNYKPKLGDKPSSEPTLEKVQTSRPTPATRKPSVNDNKYLDFRAKYVSLKPKIKRPSLPMTSAKLNQISIAKKSKNDLSVSSVPPGAFTIELDEVFGVLTNGTTSDIQTNTISTKIDEDDEPMKMSFDLETSIVKKADTQELSPSSTTTTTSTTTVVEVVLSSTTSTKRPPYIPAYKNLSSMKQRHEKVKPSSAREEIQEVLSDRDARTNLTRILESRNMTVEELVAQRERGSSQLHLADIFHNRTREPEPPNEPLIGRMRGSLERQPKSQKTKDLQSLNDSEGRVTNFPAYKIEMDKSSNDSKHLKTSQSEVLIWKSLLSTPIPPEGIPKNLSLHDDVKRIEDIENSIADAVNSESLNVVEVINEDVEDDDYDSVSFFRLPLGVRSAIIASAAIVTVSCLIFLTIFATFKWSQHQKKRLRYVDSLTSSTRIKSPILESARPKRSIKTIMSETLGRRKRKYSNVYPQSMSDYAWDNPQHQHQHHHHQQLQEKKSIPFQ